MALRINFNYQAAASHTALVGTERAMNKSLLRLSTGLRILNAADDAAGLFIADQLAVVSAGLEQGNRNIQTAISALQIAENSAGQIFGKLKEIYIRAVSAANDINDPNARSALQREINAFVDAIQKIATDTEYNGVKLLDGTFTGKYIHYGARKDQVVRVSISNLQTSALGAYTATGTGSSNALSGDGTTNNPLNSGNWTSTDYVVDGSDSLQITVGSTTVNLTGSQLGVSSTDFGSNRFVDASTIANSINSNSTLQQLGISASATNSKNANAAFGASLGTVNVNGINGTASAEVQVKIYAGGTKVFDKTYSQTYNSTGAGQALGPDLDTLINDINTSTLNGGVVTASKDDTGTKLKLTTANGETVLVEVSVKASTDDATDDISASVDLQKLVASTTAATVTAAQSGGAGDTTGIGSGVNIGDLVIASVEDFQATPSGINFTNLSSTNFESLNNIDVTSNPNAEKAILIAQTAIRKVDTIRSQIGAVMNNLQSIYDAQKVAQDNTNEAENVIRNVDFAKEMIEFTKQQVRMQSSMAMLAQANALPQLVLQLLR